MWFHQTFALAALGDLPTERGHVEAAPSALEKKNADKLLLLLPNAQDFATRQYERTTPFYMTGREYESIKLITNDL